jgi:hypothetical protein
MIDIKIVDCYDFGGTWYFIHNTHSTLLASTGITGLWLQLTDVFTIFILGRLSIQIREKRRLTINKHWELEKLNSSICDSNAGLIPSKTENSHIHIHDIFSLRRHQISYSSLRKGPSQLICKVLLLCNPTILIDPSQNLSMPDQRVFWFKHPLLPH